MSATDHSEPGPGGGTAGWLERIGRLPANPWFAYLALLAVQLRGLWSVWDRTTSAGDWAVLVRDRG
ncbi:MAG: hypothetical protein JJE23_06375 [Thermoleophilia bacterium]|nr:hypothetical protein [Thermoleophilia bacterium]